MIRNVSIKFDCGFVTTNIGVSPNQVLLGRGVPSDDLNSKVQKQTLNLNHGHNTGFRSLSMMKMESAINSI